MKFLKFFAFLPLCLSLYSCGKPSPKVIENDDYTFFQDHSYGEHERHLFDLYLPKNPTKRHGLILNIHGGGWVAGDKESFGDSLPAQVRKYGLAAAAIDYRYVNGKDIIWSDLLDDITASLNAIKSLAAEHDFNLTTMSLTGGSAGAHLSLLYAYRVADKAPIRPVSVVSLSGPTDFNDPNYFPLGDEIVKMCEKVTGVSMLDGITPEEKEALRGPSPVDYVTANTVPTLLAHSTVDTIIPYSNAETLKQKLDECGVKNDLVVFPTGGHGLSPDPEALEELNAKTPDYIAML